jgi:hypothetical protein
MKSFLGQGRDHYFYRVVEEEILAELLSFLPNFGQRRLDCREQVRGIEWFVKKINGAFVEGFLSSFTASAGRYEDDRQVWTLEPDATL